MATATHETEAPQSNAVAKTDSRTITYVPLGSKNTIDLTIGMVRKFLCTPTRQGNQPTEADIVRFMMLCKARELDPWAGDAYLTGYDTQDGPVFSLIPAAQALLKRAEISPEYDGMESGVIIKKGDAIEYREGDLILDGETLVGGWARCFRKDRKHPSFDALKLSTFDTKKSRWAKDPAGMIVKCAESSVLRKSFPTQLGGLYTREEMDHLSQGRIENRDSGSVNGTLRAAANLDELADRIETQVTAKPLQVEAERTEPTADKTTDPAADLTPWEARIAEAETLDQLDGILESLTNSKMKASDMNTVANWVSARRKAMTGK